MCVDSAGLILHFKVDLRENKYFKAVTERLRALNWIVTWLLKFVFISRMQKRHKLVPKNSPECRKCVFDMPNLSVPPPLLLRYCLPDPPAELRRRGEPAGPGGASLRDPHRRLPQSVRPRPRHSLLQRAVPHRGASPQQPAVGGRVRRRGQDPRHREAQRPAEILPSRWCVCVCVRVCVRVCVCCFRDEGLM